MTAAEAQRGQLADSVLGGDDRQILVQVAGGLVVEMVTVVVLEHDQVQRREVGNLAGRPDLAPGVDAVP